MNHGTTMIASAALLTGAIFSGMDSPIPGMIATFGAILSLLSLVKEWIERKADKKKGEE